MSLDFIKDEDGENWSLHNTPIYKEVSPELLLIGVVHRDFKKNLPERKIFEFKRELHSLEQLAFESREEIHNAVKRRNYERIAHTFFKGQKHYLDGHSSYIQILMRQGISPEMFTIFDAIRNLKVAVASSGEETLDNLKFMFDFKRKSCFGTENVDMDAVMLNAKMILARIMVDSKNVDFYGDAVNAFINYLRPLRDREVYSPELERLSELPGKKGVILGAAHIDYLYRLLKREIQTPFPRWQDYVNTLDEKTQKGVQLIENFVSEKCQKIIRTT